MFDLHPLMILLVGIVTVVGLIIALRVNAFIALITAAMVVSVLAPGEMSEKISRVAGSFGKSAAGIGIVIGMAAVIGKAMMDSGAADRIVRMFLGVLGEKRGGTALMSSGFVLAVPVFFDTVFYLLVPLARSLRRQTGKDFVKYVLAIAAGAAITHTLVPPTPGPLAMADNLAFDIGMMILIGLFVAVPSAIVGLSFAGWMNHKMPIPMRSLGGAVPEPKPLTDDQLPSLFWSLMPVVLPVLMISTNTVLTTLANAERAALFQPAAVTDWDKFREKLNEQASADQANPGKHLVARLMELDDSAGKWLKLRTATTDEQKQQITDLLNTVIGDKNFYDEKAFLGILLPKPARGLLRKDKARMTKVEAERLNRLVLQAAYLDLIAEHEWNTPKRKAANVASLFGNANLALLIAAAIAMVVYVRQRKPDKNEFSDMVEAALMSAGVIILITAAGGAFGDMLKVAEVGDAIQRMFQGDDNRELSQFTLLGLGFLIAIVLKIAQGSSTVAMIVTSGMVAAMVPANLADLGYHPVYLATAIGSGSLIGSWMNDSGFWIFAKMSGFTEVEALKTWTILLIVLGSVGMLTTLLLAWAMPLKSMI